jgi:hypothetical protein
LVPGIASPSGPDEVGYVCRLGYGWYPADRPAAAGRS